MAKISEIFRYDKCGFNKLAVMGGAYGNVPALEGALAFARDDVGCDGFVFLGDSTGCCGHSDQIIDLVREHFPVLVAGNHEQNAASGSGDCGCNYTSAEDEKFGIFAHQFAMRSLGDTNRQWLGTWPDLATLETRAGRLLLCHGSPDQTNEFLWESEFDPARVAHWLDDAGAIGMLCTHTGFPWVKHLPDGRFAANCGVIGKPDNDGDTAVHFATIDLKNGGNVRIERVEYDHDAWASQLEAEGVGETFTTPLRKGVWTSGLASAPPAERVLRKTGLERERDHNREMI